MNKELYKTADRYTSTSERMPWVLVVIDFLSFKMNHKFRSIETALLFLIETKDEGFNNYEQ